MVTYRLLNYNSPNSSMNLAVEEAILRCVSIGKVTETIRIWRNPPSVVLGRFRDVHEDVDLETCNRLKVKVVRRSSGGGTVYHDYGNLNWSLIANINSSDLDLSHVKRSYEILSRGIIKSLKSFNIKATFNPPSSIYVQGRKISGMAQQRFYNCLLLHGTLLINADVETMGKVLKMDKPRKHVVNLSELIGVEVSMKDVKRALIEGFKKTFNIDFQETSITERELKAAEELYEAKYGRIEWIMRL